MGKTVELLQRRIRRGKESTLSTLQIGGVLIKNYYQLEDEDKNLTSAMTLAAIAAVKVHGRTAIPSGRYRMVWSKSTRFGIYTWELLGVPGFAGIRFHKGNYIGDTEGCQLPGLRWEADKQGYLVVWDSGKALAKLEKELAPYKTGKIPVWYTIEQAYAA